MNEALIVELAAEAVVYYSQNDEAAFFGWLDKIDCVVGVNSRGCMLYINVDYALVDQYNLRDMLALFHRYEIDKKQLIKLDRLEFSPWFRDRQKYWFAEIFGE